MSHKIQIDDLVRDATPEETAAIDAQQAAAAKTEAARKTKEEARAAVLAKLGLTADEAAALFG
jgi:hypothetical protein